MPKDTRKTDGYFNIVSSEDNNPLLIKELAGIWFAYIEKIMRLSSYARYHSHVVKYILPYIGDMAAGSFNRIRCHQYLVS